MYLPMGIHPVVGSLEFGESFQKKLCDISVSDGSIPQPSVLVWHSYGSILPLFAKLHDGLEVGEQDRHVEVAYQQ